MYKVSTSEEREIVRVGDGRIVDKVVKLCYDNAVAEISDVLMP